MIVGNGDIATISLAARARLAALVWADRLFAKREQAGSARGL
ncbi:MAG TPA: hypothetical protein VMC83_20255 [Streptosporangiaceae bacterium]|nr:hypothetical protein [Streptosporangiaceae bacterium]